MSQENRLSDNRLQGKKFIHNQIVIITPTPTNILALLHPTLLSWTPLNQYPYRTHCSHDTLLTKANSGRKSRLEKRMREIHFLDGQESFCFDGCSMRR